MAKNHLAKIHAEMKADKKRYAENVKISFETGVEEGYARAFEDSIELWTTILGDTKGVGPKTFSAVIQTAREAIQKVRIEREGEIRPEVIRVRQYLREKDQSERVE